MKQFTLSFLLFLPLFLLAQKQNLTIHFTEIPSNDGRLLVSLFNGKNSYTSQKPYLTKSLDIENFSATWKLDSIPQGTYIIAAVHDENINGKLDFAETGMPEEAFAFSNNVQPKMGPPNPDEMIFTIKENESAVQNIKMLFFGMKSKQIKEVDVVADKKQFVKTDADKTTYQVKDNPTLTSGSMRDAVRKLPGVVLSPTGDLNLNGKDVAIYIDGVPSNLSGSDLKNYLQSIPANTIEKIELIENPGASYEANSSGAVINIITRSIATQDVSGTLNFHYGNSNNHKFSPSVMLLGRKNKINWQLQSGYNWHEQHQENDVSQTFYSFEPDVIFKHNSEQNNLNRNMYIRPMLNYRLSQNSYIVFNYNLNASNNRDHTTSTSFTENLDKITEYGKNYNYTTIYRNPEVNRNNEFVAKYKVVLDSMNRSLQITGYYSNYNKKSNAQSEQKTETPIYGINAINMNLNNAYGKVDLEIPFEKISFTLGGKYNITDAHNLGKYNLNNTSSDIFNNPTYKSEIDFNYNEQNLAAYAEARKTIGKLSATLGVRIEDLKYESRVASADTVIGDRITNVFPTVNLLYRLIPNVNLSARYSRRISMPAYSQLDPNTNGYFDSFASAEGNQNLKPNFFDNYFLSISAFNYASLGSYLRYSKNISLTSTVVEPNSLKTKMTSVDYENTKIYGAYLALPVPFGLFTKGTAFFKQPMNMEKMSYAYLYLSCNFNDIKDYPYPIGTGKKPLWMFNINTHVVLPYEFTLDGNWFHMFKGNFQIYSIKEPMNYWLVDLTRKFMNERLEVTAEVMKDISQHVAFNIENLKTDFFGKQDGTTFWIKLSYRFGKFKSKEETHIDVEKKEVEGGGINVRK
ncbi:putative TonB-dependent receptor plug [uncultured Paludibacter sp.]|uniref:Putative TonB-dependent receptor plug n=1 Tax=uncultured Paludibacter sp. TaxID=497635 RepID=A0A653AGK6_9BACT|nr:putative TonB-dependent receptor plug [uncultured Paludibacter sp.]